ncbi:MAG: hypothetical protein KDA78_04040, partial [Planctomycetaceae bacterium]|nr:hypothetical protein [Planctomycetaceae bacterium]
KRLVITKIIPSGPVSFSSSTFVPSMKGMVCFRKSSWISSRDSSVEQTYREMVGKAGQRIDERCRLRQTEPEETTEIMEDIGRV